MEQKEFLRELAALINKASLEQIGDVPDFILAEAAYDAILLVSNAARKTNNWYLGTTR